MEDSKKVCTHCNNEEESFAMSLLRGMAKQNRRWFITCMVIASMWLVTIAGFSWFVSTL